MIALKNRIYSFRSWYLAPLHEDQVNEDYLKWVNDAEVTEFLFLKNFNHTIESLKKFVRDANQSDNRIMFGIYTNQNRHIGNLSIYDINPVHKTFDFGYFIGEKEFWGTDAGMSSCLLAFKIAFEELQLRKTFTYVESINLRSRFVLQKIGFVKEAVLKDRVCNNGKFVDSVIYSLSSEQWFSSVKEKYQVN